MVALFLSPIYIIVCLYILRGLLRWMDACHHCFKKKWIRLSVIVVYAFVALSLLISFLLPVSELQRVLKHISNYWLGTLMYIMMIAVAAEAIYFILKRVSFPHKEKLFSRAGAVAVGTACLCLVAAFTAVGIFQAHNIRTTDYQVAVDKNAGGIKSLNVVLVADLHLGYSIGNRHMERMVEKINDMNPDLVVVAGDIFDNEYEALDDPERIADTLAGIESKYGVYACYGNHDVEEKILAGFTFSQNEKKVSSPEMDAFLEKSDIRLLRDEGVLIEDAVYLYGRPDLERPGRGIDKRLEPARITENMDKTKPIIVIDHEPEELAELSAAGVDVDLCGHTHNGQMFPGNILIKLFNENPYGYLKKGNMHNIVTSGIGVFGPNMRVGTKSEICRIRIDFGAVQ